MWVLAHGWEPVDEPPPSPDVVVGDAGQLWAALQVKAAGPPYYFTLREVPDDPIALILEQVSLWLGGPWAAVSWIKPVNGGRSIYRTARADPPLALAGVHFEDGSQGILLGPEALLPATEVIEAALYFFEQRELSPRLTWIGWDA